MYQQLNGNRLKCICTQTGKTFKLKELAPQCPVGAATAKAKKSIVLSHSPVWLLPNMFFLFYLVGSRLFCKVLLDSIIGSRMTVHRGAMLWTAMDCYGLLWTACALRNSHVSKDFSPSSPAPEKSSKRPRPATGATGSPRWMFALRLRLQKMEKRTKQVSSS